MNEPMLAPIVENVIEDVLEGEYKWDSQYRCFEQWVFSPQFALPWCSQKWMMGGALHRIHAADIGMVCWKLW